MMDGWVAGWTEITLRDGQVGWEGEWAMFTSVGGRLSYRLAAKEMGKQIGGGLNEPTQNYLWKINH